MKVTIRPPKGRRKRWEVDCHARGGFRKRLTARTESEAEELADALRAELGDPDAIRDRPRSVTELLDRYDEHLVAENRAEKTRRNYRWAKGHAVSVLGKRTPQSIRRGDYQRLQRALRDRGLSTSAVSLCLRVVRACFRHAFVNEWLAADPFGNVTPPRVPDHPVDWVRQDEWSALVDGLPERYRFVATLMVATGVRMTECRAVDWSDLDLRRGTLTVRAAKGGKSRVVPILPTFVSAIQAEHLRRGRPDRGRLMDCCPEILRKYLRQASLRALRRRLKPHDLRRTYATWAWDAGVRLRSVSKALGHSSISVTERWYAQVRRDEVYDDFRAAFRPEKRPEKRRNRRGD